MMGNYLLPLLEINPNEVPSFSEGALYGLQMLLIGMLIVFSVLALLWLSLEISGRIFKKLAEGAKPTVEKKPEPVAVAEVKVTDDTELIAVLTAAIAAMESAPAARFRVVSFKRK